MTTPRPRTLRTANHVTHEFVREVLPWRVNDTLEPAVRARVDAHVAACAECRAELAREQRFVEVVEAAPVVELAPQAGLGEVLARIDRRERRRRWWLPLTRFAHPLPVAVALQAGVILALASFLIFAPGRDIAPSYRALTDAPAGAASGPTLRVVFADDLSLGELRSILGPLEASIVDGPRGPGIYTLRLADGASDDVALAALRTDARVRFAESAGTR